VLVLLLRVSRSSRRGCPVPAVHIDINHVLVVVHDKVDILVREVGATLLDPFEILVDDHDLLFVFLLHLHL